MSGVEGVSVATAVADELLVAAAGFADATVSVTAG
jgi:hypothetical protein